MLANLAKKLKNTGAGRNTDSPSIFTVIQKCVHYQIPYQLMASMNYNDLLYLVIEKDIESVKEQLEFKRKQDLNKRGIEVVPATNEDILNM